MSDYRPRSPRIPDSSAVDDSDVESIPDLGAGCLEVCEPNSSFTAAKVKKISRFLEMNKINTPYFHLRSFQQN